MLETDHTVRPVVSDGLHRVGFIATRIFGTDGVSLEVGKWDEIFQRLGFDCYYIAGKSDRPEDRSFIIPEADFLDSEIAEIHGECFGRRTRSVGLSNKLHDLSTIIKAQLYEAIETFGIDVLVVQNALTIPLNIPLGTALVELLAETRIPCILHHHDFYWERDRFLVNCVEDYLRAAFPPSLPRLQHVVINSLAGDELSRRTGQPYSVIPNVMNFARGPGPVDEYAASLRDDLGIAEDEILILQPTRVVQRKGIEHAVQLVRLLEGRQAKLVVTHSADDEGDAYRQHLDRYAKMLGVEVLFAEHVIGAERSETPTGAKRYAIWDAYPEADLITYPSSLEGFGNAFVEAVYYRKPILCNRYTIYRTEIEPLGFRSIVMDGFIDQRVVSEVAQVLDNEELRSEIVEHNYQLGRRYFSFERLEQELVAILRRIQCCD